MRRCIGWVLFFLWFISCTQLVIGASNYGVVVDLGSKGSRVGVFVWPSDARDPYTQVVFGGGKNPWYSKINPGVATFVDNPSAAGPYLKPLLDYAKQNVPSAQQSSTPIFIRGTDGLRKLPDGASTAILTSILGYTQSNYNFLLTRDAISLLSGVEEGGCLWITLNYLLQTFENNDVPIGSIDLGSGSIQIVFMPTPGTYLPPNYTYEFDYKDSVYLPYAHSYSGYGYLSALYTLNQTLSHGSPNGFVRNPCLLYGYSAPVFYVGEKAVTMQGSGSWAECSTLTYAFLDTNAPCSFPPCSFAGAFQPPIFGDFLAVSNFADVTEILGFADQATPAEIIEAGIQFCSLTWSEARALHPDTDPEDLYTFCFGANYVATLLTKGLGFPVDTTINFGKKHNKAPYSWVLGEMVQELQRGW